MDVLWMEAIEQTSELDLAEQAYRLGELAAWQYNKMEDSGYSSMTEARRIEDAYERADNIADIIGEIARERFAAGFDEAIDFSLNADWRMQR
jgi:hypothetical protein